MTAQNRFAHVTRGELLEIILPIDTSFSQHSRWLVYSDEIFVFKDYFSIDHHRPIDWPKDYL
jgi:hypothetical protein